MEILIIPYHSFATQSVLMVKGRVLRNKRIEVNDDDSVWDNLVNSYKRMESDEIPHAEVEIRFHDQSWNLTCDDEGYYKAELPLNNPLSYKGAYLSIEVQLIKPDFGKPYVTEGLVILPPENADFGIISDVDDTIMETGATSFRKMAILTFLKNVHNRHAFSGVAAFYQALEKGPNQTNRNPFYYVSSSPWNLYDLITDFIELNEIPQGPLFLRDLGLDEHKFITEEHGDHKSSQIERLLKTYPERKYILIGDSGQQDVFIYYQMAKAFPDRFLAIYIRDAKDAHTLPAVAAQIQQAQSEGIDMILMKDSLAGAKHAAEKGFIHVNAVEEVEKSGE